MPASDAFLVSDPFPVPDAVAQTIASMGLLPVTHPERLTRPVRHLLFQIAKTRHVFCLPQAELTRKLWEKAVWQLPTEADVADLQKQMALVHARLSHLRDELKQTDLRAWRVHHYGLNLVLDEEERQGGHS